MDAELASDLSQVVQPPLPSAGGGFTYTLPGSEYSRIRSCAFQLVTDANAGSRAVTLDFVDGSGEVLARHSPNFTQATGITALYTFAIYLNVYGANDATAIGAPLAEMWLRKGCKLRVNVGTVKAGDQISKIRVVLDQLTATGNG